MLAHMRDQRNKKESSPLYRHDVKHHNGEKQQYTTDIIASEKKIVKLSSLEAVHIEKCPNHQIMNERMERGRGGVVRITATRVT